jgi:type VII secretion-associated serine protease mycosin
MGGAMNRLMIVLATGVLAALATAPPAAGAPPAGACANPAPARPVITKQPWAQQVLDPRRVWPYSTGAGVLVAVVDSGVDADHPQLRAPGKVLPGRDFFLVGQLPGDFDCVSHGTAVASIIAADPAPGIGFAGIAPGARILPVAVTDADLTDSGQPAAIDPNVIARGIRYAADQGAKVINLSLSGPTDFPQVRAAVAAARRRDALVVAAVGNAQTSSPGAPSFPAAYPGVVGVGAIDISGAADQNSQVGPFVDLMAPGTGVVGASRVAGHEFWNGTSLAAAFVSGTAALVRAAWPDLTAPQVASRLMATASVARGGAGSQQYGAGIVNPYRAVTEGLSGTPKAMAPLATPPVNEAALRERHRWQHLGLLAELAAGVAVSAILVAAIAAVVLPRARRRGWRASVATLPQPRRREPPEQLFLFRDEN